jgi:hypothetical protein
VHDFELPIGERTRTGAAERGEADAAHPLRSLQTAVGNQAVARMLQREGAPEEEEEIQAKHDPSLAAVQREGAPEEEEEIQAKHDGSAGAVAQRAPEVGLAGGPVSGGLSSRIESQRGGGSPLDGSTRSQMEGALGSSLDGVRVHVGQESDALNHAITAKAFTTGSDVFVRSDQWAPGSSSTQRLLAHELTHVVQQRTMSGGGPMSVGAADTSEEREADAVADAVAQRAADPQQADENDAAM